MPIVLDFGSMGTGMKNTTCSPMAFILSGVALSNPYRIPRTKKKVISQELKNLRARM